MAKRQERKEDWAASSLFLGKVAGAIGCLALACFLLTGVLDPVSFERFVLGTVFEFGLAPLFVASGAGLACAVKALLGQDAPRMLGIALVLNGGGFVLGLAVRCCACFDVRRVRGRQRLRCPSYGRTMHAYSYGADGKRIHHDTGSLKGLVFR
jgi:hypothetical protein